MITIKEMMKKSDKTVESKKDFYKIIEELKAKAKIKQTEKETKQAQTRAKFAEMIAKAKAAKVEAEQNQTGNK